jgi:hypothetical protein
MSRRLVCLLLPVSTCAFLAVALTATSSAAASSRPTVSSVSPSSGPLAGGAKITIRGVHLGGTHDVLVGRKRATRVHVLSPTTVTAVVPAKPGGAYHVRIQRRDGTTSAATSTGTFTYLPAPAVSGVRLADGNGRVGSSVVISGHHLSDATRVQFGAKPATATSVHGHTIIATVPSHRPGLVHVTVSSPGGTSAKRQIDLYPMPTAVSEQWALQAHLDIGKNELADVSCATATHCVAVDQRLDAWTIDDGVWSAPVQLPGMIERISCPTVEFCVGANGAELEIYQNGAWSRGPTMTSGSWGGPHGISCATADFCVATSPTEYRVYSDGVWSDEKPVPIVPYSQMPALFESVACYDDTDCVAGSETGVYLFDGTGWALMASAGGGMETVSCASATLCAAKNNSGPVSVWDGATWSTPVTFPDTSWRDNDLACTGSTCFYDTSGGIYAYRDGFWQGAADSTYALYGCASTTYCIGEDELGHIGTFDGTDWQPTATRFATVGLPSVMSCPAATFCAMTDKSGNAYTYDGVRWSDPDNLADTHATPSAVSCPTASFCLASFGDRTVARYNGSGWQPEAKTQRVETTLTCVTADVCFAAGAHDAERFDGGAWSVLSTGAPIVAMSCPSVTFCAATTPDSVETWDGTRWTTTVQDDQLWDYSSQSLACPTVDFCLVGDAAGRAIIYRSGTWSLPEPTLTDEPLKVACYSPTFCQVFGVEDDAQTYDGRFWSAVAQSGDVNSLFDVQALGCYAPSRCIAATAEGQLYASRSI